jgi:hypothetical protein
MVLIFKKSIWRDANLLGPIHYLNYPPTKRLDRALALMSIEREFKYPVVSLQVKDRGVSDHTPHLLDMREHQPFKAKGKQFRIELSWFTMRI